MTTSFHSAGFDTDVAYRIWGAKYRFADEQGMETCIEDTWQRVASAVAFGERIDRDMWQREFRALLSEFRFLPGGRVLAGAGTARRATLFNCFVMGPIEDSIDGIFNALKEGAVTLQYGGGVGYDFSTLRPRGARAAATNGRASGPVSFLGLWDQCCSTLLSTGVRRGAMMGVLRCDHPDVLEFIDAKREAGALTHFNLSILITDDFLSAVDNDREWPLIFPAHGVLDSELPEAGGDSSSIVERVWSGGTQAVPCRVVRQVGARDLWRRIVLAAYERAEPGVLFIDRINRDHNLHYLEQITATNPCGELPLPAYGACNLGSLNLPRYVRGPFTSTAHLDIHALENDAGTAIRFLDDMIDVSQFPLEQQRIQALSARRVGLGITGLADALLMLGLRYDSDEACETAQAWTRAICHSAYRASVDIAKDKGAFPSFERDPYLSASFVRELPSEIRDEIAKHGIRNSQLLAIAPAGTISLLAGGVSSGIEPIFEADYDRAITGDDGQPVVVSCSDYACRLWRELQGTKDGTPPAYVDAYNISPDRHLLMQASLQRHVDGAISKTVNVPVDIPFGEFQSLFDRARASGVKGFTAFRPNPTTGVVIHLHDERLQGPHCCHPEREAD